MQKDFHFSPLLSAATNFKQSVNYISAIKNQKLKSKSPTDGSQNAWKYLEFSIRPITVNVI